MSDAFIKLTGEREDCFINTRHIKTVYIFNKEREVFRFDESQPKKLYWGFVNVEPDAHDVSRISQTFSAQPPMITHHITNPDDIPMLRMALTSCIVYQERDDGTSEIKRL